MIIEKRCLSEAVKVLGKCCGVSKEVRFVGVDGDCWASVWDGEEMVSIRMECEALPERVDFVVGVKELRELIRSSKTKVVEVVGEFKRVADMIIPNNAVMLELPDDFCSLIGAVASVVDRSESRAILRGIHLCSEGVVATDGKQLLHIPCSLNLPQSITLPFPLALLLARLEGEGSLAMWDDWFFISIGNLTWSGKCLQGEYPNWKQAIPSEKVLNYSISLSNSEEVLNFLKLVPDIPEVNGIELNVTPQGVSVVPLKYPQLECKTKAEFKGIKPRMVLTLNKPILVQMLMQGYHTFQTNSDGNVAIVASGGRGVYVAMPVRNCPQIKIKKEDNVETETKIEVTPMEELNSNIEEFRNKLKTLLDESNFLIRKVKEVSLQQKQKEREFVQAKRAIERIKMAI